MDVDANSFYGLYKDRGVISAAVPPVLLILCSVAAGTWGNFRIVYATLQSRALRGTCNYLIALCSFADSVHLCAHFFLAYLVFSGKNFVPLENCYHMMSVPLVGLVVGQTLILLIGVDRLLSTIAPRRYQAVRKSFYLGVVVAVCTVTTSLFLVIAYHNVRQTPNMPVLCVIVEAFHGTPMFYFQIFAFSTVVGSVACYVFIWIYVRRNLTTAGDQQTRLLRSLAVITAIVAGCYGLGYLSAILFASGENSTLVHLYNGIGINIGCSCNYYILYAMSPEYRKDFTKPAVGVSLGDATVSSNAGQCIAAA